MALPAPKSAPYPSSGETLADRTRPANRERRLPKHLVLVDFENIQKLDLSILDETYRAIVFVGARQEPPRAARRPATAHRFARVEFHKVEGSGPNALDFHIACHLGRVLETERQTQCIVLSKDKGFDPLLRHLNNVGLSCRRIESLLELLAQTPALQPVLEPAADAQPLVLHEPSGAQIIVPDQVVCGRCRKSETIEHLGGQWCTNCGHFASPPDPSQLPSLQIGSTRQMRSRGPLTRLVAQEAAYARLPSCGWCAQKSDMVGGIYDDGEWMCGGCIGRYAD